MCILYFLPYIEDSIYGLQVTNGVHMVETYFSHALCCIIQLIPNSKGHRIITTMTTAFWNSMYINSTYITIMYGCHV